MRGAFRAGLILFAALLLSHEAGGTGGRAVEEFLVTAGVGSQYLAALVNEGVDTVGDLALLTDVDLDAIGMKLVHRRRLQRVLAGVPASSAEAVEHTEEEEEQEEEEEAEAEEAEEGDGSEKDEDDGDDDGEDYRYAHRPIIGQSQHRPDPTGDPPLPAANNHPRKRTEHTHPGLQTTAHQSHSSAAAPKPANPNQAHYPSDSFNRFVILGPRPGDEATLGDPALDSIYRRILRLNQRMRKKLGMPLTGPPPTSMGMAQLFRVHSALEAKGEVWFEEVDAIFRDRADRRAELHLPQLATVPEFVGLQELMSDGNGDGDGDGDGDDGGNASIGDDGDTSTDANPWDHLEYEESPPSDTQDDRVPAGIRGALEAQGVDLEAQFTTEIFNQLEMDPGQGLDDGGSEDVRAMIKKQVGEMLSRDMGGMGENQNIPRPREEDGEERGSRLRRHTVVHTDAPLRPSGAVLNDIAHRLAQHGVVVVDGFRGGRIARRMHTEAVNLYKRNDTEVFVQSRVGTILKGGSGVSLQGYRGDEVAWGLQWALNSAVGRKTVLALNSHRVLMRWLRRELEQRPRQVQEDLNMGGARGGGETGAENGREKEDGAAAAAGTTPVHVFEGFLDSMTDMMLTSYKDGAQYGPHFDGTKGTAVGSGSNRGKTAESMSGNADGREITALYYFNPGWREEWGGALRVRTTTIDVHGQVQPSGNTIDIGPAFDRFVLFRSRHVEHQVLPATEQRFACTVWLGVGLGDDSG